MSAGAFAPMRLAVYALIAFLYLPIIVVAVFAFNSGSNLSWPIQGLSMRWFTQIFSDPDFSRAFRNSAIASSIVAAAAVMISTAAAFLFTRFPSGPARVLKLASLLPAMLPPLFIAMALFTAMSYLGIQPGMRTIVLGQLLVTIPFVLTIVLSRLRGFDPFLEPAARDLGAGPLQALLRITLRIAAPALFGAALLGFAFSFDEVLITNFTSGTMPTLPLYINSRLRRLIDPSINAVATFLLFVPWVALLVSQLFMNASKTWNSSGDRTN